MGIDGGKHFCRLLDMQLRMGAQSRWDIEITRIERLEPLIPPVIMPQPVFFVGRATSLMSEDGQGS